MTGAPVGTDEQTDELVTRFHSSEVPPSLLHTSSFIPFDLESPSSLLMLCIKQVVYIQFTYLMRHVSIPADLIISISFSSIHLLVIYISYVSS